MPRRPLTAKERALHDQGLVTVRRQIHDELDAVVAEAYGLGGRTANIEQGMIKEEMKPWTLDIPC